MIASSLSEHCISRLTLLTDLLIQSFGKLPCAHEVDGFGKLLETAAIAASLSPADVEMAAEQLPHELQWDTVRKFALERDTEFQNLSLVCSGAYTMAPEVLERLGFPIERRNPAGLMDAADEYGSGILEPVLNSGKTFRDPRSI